MQQKYFAASNSAQGFQNYFGLIFARADFLYIIKGGPGTGKSSFMKKCAAIAEDNGATVEYYYCSSDPTSLDGILIFSDGRVTGFIDGTAPHVSEPQLPGAREEIINLGQFWNRELLHKQKNEIEALCDRKSAEYKNAYTFLRSVGNLRAVSDCLVRDALDIEKMDGAARRLLRSALGSWNTDRAQKSSIIPAITDSVSMCGRVRFDTFERLAKKIYFIGDLYGAGQMFLDCVLCLMKEKGISARVSYDPVCSSHVDGIFIEDVGVALICRHDSPDGYDDTVTQGAEVTYINMGRFFDRARLREARSEIRYTSRLARNALDGAIYSLSKAKIYHFLLEDIYGKAMDWRAKDEWQKGIGLGKMIFGADKG
jgi:hypothetical protein